MDYEYEGAMRILRRMDDYDKRRTRWFVRIPEREKEYPQYKWEGVLCRRFDCIKRIADSMVLLRSLGEPELTCYCSVIEFSEEMSLDILVRVVDPCKWVVSVGEYQITIYGSPRKFLINEGILENNSIKGHQLMRYCERFIDKNGAQDFSELKKTVPLGGLPAHF